MTFEEMYDTLDSIVMVDSEALDLAFSVGGRTKETAEKILFYYTGWGNFEGFLDEVSES